MVCIRNILKELYVPWGYSFGTNAIVRAFIRYVACVAWRFCSAQPKPPCYAGYTVRSCTNAGTNGATYAMVTHDHVLLLLRLEMNFPDIFQISHHM